MKKKLLCFAAFFTVFAGISFADEPVNLIRNPQFLETKSKNPDVPDGRLPDPWWVYGGIGKLPEGSGVSRTEKPEGYEGNSYLVAGKCLVSQSSLAVIPGKTYRVSCKVKTKDTAPTAQIRLQIIWLDKSWRELMKEWTDKSGKKQKSWDHKWTWVKSAPEWKELVIPAFTAPANAKYAKIRFGNDNTKEGFAWFADFRMEEVAGEAEK